MFVPLYNIQCNLSRIMLKNKNNVIAGHYQKSYTHAVMSTVCQRRNATEMMCTLTDLSIYIGVGLYMYVYTLNNKLLAKISTHIPI